MDVDVEGELGGGGDVDVRGHEDPALEIGPSVVVLGEARSGLLAVKKAEDVESGPNRSLEGP